ncbi:MAG: hypothetical protein NC548_30400 [Lachnospiraceae bacterium]|nr:hypothetical protein [Lachnospiraceae bacterium]
MKFAENPQRTAYAIAPIAESTWTIAMRSVIRLAKMNRGIAAKSVSVVNTICTMFMERSLGVSYEEFTACH